MAGRGMSALVFPRGQLTSEDRARLDAAGIVAVEADDPAAVVLMLPATAISGDAIALSALTAISESPLDSTAAKFVRLLTKAMQRAGASA